MNSAKRRRLDATASTLRKPFRSPLKVPADDPASRKPAVASDLDQQTLHPSPSQVGSLVHDSPTKSSRRLPSPNEPTLMNSLSQPIDEFTTLQKQHSALTQELRRLRQDLDVAEQARKLLVGSQGQQLDHLTLKWRDVARSAVDEVFDITSSRVKDMGGMQAWQKNTQENSQSWLDQDTFSQDNAQHYEQRDDQDEHPDTNWASNLEEDEEANDRQEQSFTITTMLRQMNIDPNLLGFDEHNNQWAD